MNEDLILRWFRTGVLAALGLLLQVFAVPSTWAQQSPSFSNERITFSAGAQPLSSANYSTTITFAQEGPVGSASRCNNGLLQSTGFWSVLGETPVPVRLSLHKNGVDPVQVDLDWSGSSSQFTVYRAVFPAALVDPFNVLLTTSLCTLTDAPPPTSITFYLVRPTGI
jgi:hypothetical protein